LKKGDLGGFKNQQSEGIFGKLYNLRVGQRPMNDCPENFPKIFFPRLWNDHDLDTMLEKPTG
jgi:hypothetical protein